MDKHENESVPDAPGTVFGSENTYENIFNSCTHLGNLSRPAHNGERHPRRADANLHGCRRPGRARCPRYFSG